MKPTTLEQTIATIYAEKWRFIVHQMCTKRGGSVLLAQGQVLTKEMIAATIK